MAKKQTEKVELKMLRALALASKGGHAVKPNPMVGAVIYNQQQIVGVGWHAVYGGAHAEVAALAQAGAKAAGGTMYVTLEPCNHFGKTPPCTESIIQAGIAKVVIAMRDPNPLVSGGGVERLIAAGVKVELGILENLARELNFSWLHSLSMKRPYVAGCLFLSLDGLAQSYVYFIEEKKFTTIALAQLTRLKRKFEGELNLDLGQEPGVQLDLLSTQKIQSVICVDLEVVRRLWTENLLDRLFVYHLPVSWPDAKPAFYSSPLPMSSVRKFNLIYASRLGKIAFSVYDVP